MWRGAAISVPIGDDATIHTMLAPSDALAGRSFMTSRLRDLSPALRRRCAGAAWLFVSIFIATAASILLSKHPAHLAAFWPANGVALIALLRLGPEVRSRTWAWTAAAGATFLANLACGKRD